MESFSFLPAVFHIAILIFSVVIHEVSHGYAALALGDRTAQNAGRLTLNPVPHIDLFGSIILPLLTFFFGGMVLGWAKPVPYSPYNLRDQKWGPALVGVAGPAANIGLAVVFGLMVRFLPVSGTLFENFAAIAISVVVLNLVLALFNLLPVPPLDGSKVLFSVLPFRFRGVEVFLETYGIFLIILLAPFLGRIISPLVFRVSFLLLGGG